MRYVPGFTPGGSETPEKDSKVGGSAVIKSPKETSSVYKRGKWENHLGKGTCLFQSRRCPGMQTGKSWLEQRQCQQADPQQDK
jgi:hypothetical protein